jgi:hypothetical protein
MNQLADEYRPTKADAGGRNRRLTASAKGPKLSPKAGSLEANVHTSAGLELFELPPISTWIEERARGEPGVLHCPASEVRQHSDPRQVVRHSRTTLRPGDHVPIKRVKAKVRSLTLSSAHPDDRIRI